mmetsp:Transcript_22264/g.52414  ORF Transcript_22264/g.52414 Transcript_22264/m.52414 type:complete len:171 (+) Transcript_22264:37-549(+)
MKSSVSQSIKIKQKDTVAETTPLGLEANEHDAVTGNNTKANGGTDAQESGLDWDDEDFEFEDLSSDVEPKILPQKEANKSAGDACDDDDNDDDWMKPLASETGPGQQDQTGNDREEAFLTSQFQRLCTPVSQKKHRCAVCTRPVAAKKIGSIAYYCQEHMPTDHHEKSSA